MLRKSWGFLIILSLLVLLVPACGDNDEGAPAATAIATAIKTATPTPSGPVKFGAISAFTGPAATTGAITTEAIDAMEQQVKDQGGILGGRQIKFIKGDDRGSTAEAASQAIKMILEDKVSFIPIAGYGSKPPAYAIADVCEQYKVGMIYFGTLDIGARQYASCLYGWDAELNRSSKFIVEYLKAKKISFLGLDTDSPRQGMDGFGGNKGLREAWETLGASVIQEQYFPADTTDFSPYITKIKYANPDVLMIWLLNIGNGITFMKQLEEQGGLGNTKIYSISITNDPKIVKMPIAQGTYTSCDIDPESSGYKAMVDAWQAKYHRDPAPYITYYYGCIQMAISAVKLAGTDEPVAVAKALRSGNLKIESCWGPITMGTNGEGEVNFGVAQIMDSKLVKVWT